MGFSVQIVKLRIRKLSSEFSDLDFYLEYGRISQKLLVKFDGTKKNENCSERTSLVWGGGEGRNNKIYKFMKNIFSLCDTHLPIHLQEKNCLC